MGIGALAPDVPAYSLSSPRRRPGPPPSSPPALPVLPRALERRSGSGPEASPDGKGSGTSEPLSSSDPGSSSPGRAPRPPWPLRTATRPAAAAAAAVVAAAAISAARAACWRRRPSVLLMRRTGPVAGRPSESSPPDVAPAVDVPAAAAAAGRGGVMPSLYDLLLA
ncbi:hypothetical protein PLESTB_000434700 [Pleodorina starrii]|uniref:Uncharacterized protein n=1 Tax=Pleodorina starrii TaxID=330485 RepID=A0A9W6BFZ6_9CHLO|nr:hypothetical protein PLESTB_000434700 [Pleodorina starrii]